MSDNPLGKARVQRLSRRTEAQEVNDPWCRGQFGPKGRTSDSEADRLAAGRTPRRHREHREKRNSVSPVSLWYRCCLPRVTGVLFGTGCSGGGVKSLSVSGHVRGALLSTQIPALPGYFVLLVAAFDRRTRNWQGVYRATGRKWCRVHGRGSCSWHGCEARSLRCTVYRPSERVAAPLCEERRHSEVDR